MSGATRRTRAPAGGEMSRIFGAGWRSLALASWLPRSPR